MNQKLTSVTNKATSHFKDFYAGYLFIIAFGLAIYFGLFPTIYVDTLNPVSSVKCSLDIKNGKLIGTVQNNSLYNWDKCWITVNIYDKQNVIVGSTFTELHCINKKDTERFTEKLTDEEQQMGVYSKVSKVDCRY